MKTVKFLVVCALLGLFTISFQSCSAEELLQQPDTQQTGGLDNGVKS